MLDGRAAVWKRQGAQDLREVGVGCRADEQPARLVAVLVGVKAEPRPLAPAIAERSVLEFCRLVQAPGLSAFAPDDEFGQVAGGAALVEPELAPAALAGAVGEPGPVEVIHMASAAGSHEPGRHHGLAVETAPLVQRPAVHEAPGALTFGVAVVVLDHEPLREAPRTDPLTRRPGIRGLRRRCVHPRGRDSGDGPEQTGEPLVDDLLQLAGVGPRLEPGDYGCLLWQV